MHCPVATTPIAALLSEFCEMLACITINKTSLYNPN